MEVSKVDSSLYATKWRAPLGTGVKKKKFEQVAKTFKKFSLHSQLAEVDEVSSQMRFQPMLVFSSVHPIFKIFVSRISHHLNCLQEVRHCEAQEESKQIHVQPICVKGGMPHTFRTSLMSRPVQRTVLPLGSRKNVLPD